MKGGGFTFKKKEDNQPKVENSMYFGCPDLDRIFDFQLNKGSTILLLEEGLSKHATALARYFAGYGLLQGERTAVFDSDVSFWKHLIPKPMEKKKIARKGDNATSKVSKTTEKAENTIAWRYNTQKIGFGKSELRSDYVVLDLSKNENLEGMADEAGRARASKVSFHSTSEITQARQLYEEVEDLIQNMPESPDDVACKRVVLTGLESMLLSPETTRSEVFKLFKGLKLLARSSHTTVLVLADPRTFKESAAANYISQAESLFDLVLSFGMIHNNKLLADFDGTITFRRMKSLDKWVQHPVEHTTYGIKSDRSSLDIELLYENSLAHTDDTNEDNKLLCGGGKPKDTSMDF